MIDRRLHLHLPTSWTDDRDRFRAAGIEDTVRFETKVVMAKALIRRASADRISFGWVTADADYGFSKGITGRADPHRGQPVGGRGMECFQTAKQECGLDDYQVRRYDGWHRRMALAIGAHARASTTSCTGHTGAADDNTKPASATTNDAATPHQKPTNHHDKDRCSTSPNLGLAELAADTRHRQERTSGLR